MTDNPQPTATEADMAVISFALVVLEVFYANDLVRPSEIDPLLARHEKNMLQAKYPIAAGILGVIRKLASTPDHERQREELRKLMQARPAGTA